MSDKILLFGKDAGPYTRAAREAFAKEGRQVDYYNVVKEPKNLDTMLEHSNGTRKVPVIVEGETVTIGFDGGTGGVGAFGWKPKGMKNVNGRMKNEGTIGMTIDNGGMNSEGIRSFLFFSEQIINISELFRKVMNLNGELKSLRIDVSNWLWLCRRHL